MATRFERRQALIKQRQQRRHRNQQAPTPSNGTRVRHVEAPEDTQPVAREPAVDPAASTVVDAPALAAVEEEEPEPEQVVQETEEARKVAELEARVVAQQQQIEKWRSMQTKAHAPPGFKIIEIKHDATQDNKGLENKDGSPMSIGRVIRYAASHSESEWVSGEHLDPAGAVKTAWERHVEMECAALQDQVDTLKAKLEKVRKDRAKGKGGKK